MLRLSLTLILFCLGYVSSYAAGGGNGTKIPQYDWSFSGVFGKYDKAQLQRGFKIYREVCASCHSMKLIAFRDIAELGYDEESIKVLAKEYLIEDGPNTEGEMFKRAGLMSDYFPLIYPNDQAAIVANGAVPPDFSLIAKARSYGADYIKALMLGYPEPAMEAQVLDEEGNIIGYKNKYYPEYDPGSYPIAMPPQITQKIIDDGIIEYVDGTPVTKEQVAEDIAAFLMWAAEPSLEQRKSLGVQVMIYLFILTILFYILKIVVWRDIKPKRQSN
jgi:cytochrome c1